MNKYTIPAILFVFLVILLSFGCGHNMSVYSKGVGAELAWRPNTVMPSIRFGSYENLDLVQRENNQVRYTSNNGVGFDWFGLKSLFSGTKDNDIGMGTVLEVKTGPQLNGYSRDILMNPDVKPEHVEIAKSIAEVKVDLGDKETQVSISGAKSNATPVVTTEKGAFGNTKVTTPTNQYTQDAIKEQVKTTGIYDMLKSYGFYIVCAVIVLLLVLAFVIVHLLEKSGDLKEIIKDFKAMTEK